MSVPGPVTPHKAGLSPTPAYGDPFVHHVDSKPPTGGLGAAKPTSADLESPPLLDRFNADQRDSFRQGWHMLPMHLREISFDFHLPGWDPDVITQLRDTLIEFADVFSTSPTDFSSCSFLPPKTPVPPDSLPVTPRPYRANPLVTKQMDTILDEYLAAVLIQHSTSTYANPVVIVPKKPGGVRLTLKYKKLNNISILCQYPITRVDEVPDKLGDGRVFFPL